MHCLQLCDFRRRYASGSTPTDYTYTGQFSDSYINLLWYGSRHYDPALGRFISPDTIVPTAVQGVQAWDRYAYTNNNPMRYTDPTGHCMGFANCFIQIFNASIFLGTRAINNGELIDKDFEDAANYAAPAVASGSKESTTLTYGMFATWVQSTTVITTDNGDIQVFDETNVDDRTGVPQGGGLPGVSVSATHGFVYGLDGDALNYTGDAVQLNVGVPVAELGGVSAEAYTSPDFSVGGVDGGLYLGVGPTILSGAKTYAEPNGNGKISSFLKQVLPDKVDGFGLFVCRMASMCGAR